MATLKADYSIKKFPSYLVIEYSKMNCINERLVKSFGDFCKDEISKDIFKSINLLLEHYENIINTISIKKFEDHSFLVSRREYMVQLISRCLKLNEDAPTFFEFLLVCVYIARFSKCIYEKYKCCKILKVTAACLEAFYVRKYSLYFMANDNFLGFAEFCKKLNSSFPIVEVDEEDQITIIPEALLNEKVNILGCLNDVDKVIELNDKEEKQMRLMDDEYFRLFRKDDLKDFLIQTTPKETDHDVDLETYDVVDDKTNKTDIPCGHCGAECAKYPEFLVDELSINETIRWEY